MATATNTPGRLRADLSNSRQQISRDNVWQMLQFVPAYDREDWIKFGMAIKSEFGESGFSMYDEWSKSADNYDSKAVITAWKSFKERGAITIGTLIHLAKTRGWVKHSDSRPPPPLKAGVDLKSKSQDTRAYALRLWLASNNDDPFVGKHPYAQLKGINWAAGAGRGIARGVKIGKDADCIIIPIRSIETEKTQGVQCINDRGDKQSFGRVSGGGLILGNTLDNSLTWYVCEGWASAVSMVFHHQKGNGVCASSFGKSNLQKLASLIDRVHKPKKIRILEEVD